MLIIETGDGLTNSNSYADRSLADPFYVDRNISDWAAATTQARDAALISATDYIDANYVFRSVRASDAQALECPRYGIDGISPHLVKATILLARHALTVDLSAMVASRDIIEKTETLSGVASEITKYDAKAVSDPFPIVTSTLRSIATRRNASASVMWLTR